MRTAILEEKTCSCPDTAALVNSTPHPCNKCRALGRTMAATTLADGRYLVYVRDGELRDPTSVSAVACMIDPTDAAQIANMLRVSVAPQVFATVKGLLKRHPP